VQFGLGLHPQIARMRNAFALQRYGLTGGSEFRLRRIGTPRIYCTGGRFSPPRMCLSRPRRVMAVLEVANGKTRGRIAVHTQCRSEHLPSILSGIEVACRINHRPTAVLEAV